jgi:hypothetical protein
LKALAEIMLHKTNLEVLFQTALLPSPKSSSEIAFADQNVERKIKNKGSTLNPKPYKE